MVQLTGQAGVLAAVGGEPSPLNIGAGGEVLTGAENGVFYEQTMRGNAYTWSTAIAGGALVAPVTTTSFTPTLINPPGSNRLLIIEKIAYNRTAVGASPPTEGGVIYAFHRAASVLGTLADIVSFTQVAGQNARVDYAASGDQSKILWVPTGIVWVGVPTFLVNSGVSIGASDGTATGVNQFMAIDQINGGIVCPPGFAFVIAGNASIVTTFAITVYGMSIPKPSYFQ